MYEKGPQSLGDTIKKVEKLQAAQQIISTLLSPSLVNTVASDNDKYFQCQEISHMAHYCPHIRCFDAIIMDTSQQIDLTKYRLQTCQHDAEIAPLVNVTDQHLRTVSPGAPTMTIETGTDSATLDPTHATPGTGVTVIVISAEVVLDHFIDLHTTVSCIT